MAQKLEKEEKMDGLLIGIGVGIAPGMLTDEAKQAIKMADMIAIPVEDKEKSRAYKLAEKAVPELKTKQILLLDFKMERDKKLESENHLQLYKEIKEYILQGKNVAFLTIGDPAIYSTFSYMMDKAKIDGICCKMISGVSAVSACAGRLGIPLSCGSEMIHIIPGIENLKEVLDYPGTKVIMKCGKNIAKVKQILKDYEERNLKSGIKIAIYAVSECGMIDEACYEGISNIPDDAGYMTTIIVKKAN